MNQSIIDILLIVAAVIVGIVASARFTRLIVADTFPPVVWLRIKYEDRVGPAWGKLLQCPWCFGPYVTLLDLAWYLLSSDGGFWREAWWVTNGWLAAAYAVSWIVFHDED